MTIWRPHRVAGRIALIAPDLRKRIPWDSLTRHFVTSPGTIGFHAHTGWFRMQTRGRMMHLAEKIDRSNVFLYINIHKILYALMYKIIKP